MGKLSNKFLPYANESDVLNIGRLTVENRVDRVTLSGDVDLTVDRPGLDHARALHNLLGDVVASLEGRDLPEQVTQQPATTVKNPFM